MLGRSEATERRTDRKKRVEETKSLLSFPRVCSLAHGDDWATAAVALPGLHRNLYRRRAGTPAPSLPFLLCETEHPNPTLSYLYLDLIKSQLYICIVLTNFDFFPKFIW
jgi:hypothetical protein